MTLAAADLNALGDEELTTVLVGAAAVLDRRRSVRAANPELADDIARAIRRSLAAGRITKARADELAALLDEVNPSVLLEAHAEEILDLDKPTIACFGARCVLPKVPDLDAFFREDPRRLAELVRAGLRFGGDVRHVVEQVLAEADRLGIDEEVADRVILRAIRENRKERSGGRAG